MSAQIFGTEQFVHMSDFLKMSSNNQQRQWQSNQNSVKETNFLKKLNQNYNPVESNSRTTHKHAGLDDSMVLPEGFSQLNMSEKNQSMNVSRLRMSTMFTDKNQSQRIGDMGMSQEFHMSLAKNQNISKNYPFGHRASLDHMEQDVDIRDKSSKGDVSTVKQQFSFGMENSKKYLPNLSHVNSSQSQALIISRSSRPSSRNVLSIR